MFFLGHKRDALRVGREAADSKQQRRWQQQQQQQVKVRPRLERLNAAKDIDYEVPSGPSSPPASPDVSTVVHTPRMLDLSLSSSHYSKQSSFRLCGSVDGEVDALCQILGLSGPEEFGIPMSAWEEHKARLSSVLARSRHLQPDGSPPENHTFASKESTFLSKSAAALDSSLTSVDTFLSKRIAVTDRERRFSDSSGYEITAAVGAEAAKSQKPFLGSGGGRNGGIRGVRPPVLAPPAPLAILPPPSCRPTSIALKLPQSMSSLATDWSTSPCAVANSVTPEVVGDDFCAQGQKLVSMENDEGGLDRDAHGLEFRGLMLGEGSEGFIGMSSYSTVNDDDTSSSSTETMINISPNGRFKTRIRSWMKGICLGSGSYGTVYEAISDEGVFFAVKEVSLVDQGLNAQHSITQLEQEIALLSQFEHENIVQYFGTDKEDSKLFIFLELVTKGSLASLYQNYPLQESQASAYTRQILNGLDYLHELNVVHRDIKCANILVHANGSVKLADFGLAKEMINFNMLKSCKGSVYWMAPEVLNPNRSYGLSADIWSLGCTVLEMLTRQVPYGNLEWAQAAYKIGHGEPPTIPKYLSKAAQDFIGQCLKLNPDARPTASQLLDHPFVRRSLRASPGSHSSHGYS